MNIAERLKTARAALHLKQDEVVAISGIPLNTYRKYEGGKSEPGAKALAGLAKCGIDLNWLITGASYVTDAKGKQFFTYPVATVLKVAEPAAAALVSIEPAGINVDAMVQAISVMFETAKDGETVEQSARKAVAFYQYCQNLGLITPEGEGKGDLKKAG